MAKTASLKATNRPGVRCTEEGSCPALPPGARAVASECTQRFTEATHVLLVGDGITGTSSYEDRSLDRGERLRSRRQGFAAPFEIDATTEPPNISASHPHAIGTDRSRCSRPDAFGDRQGSSRRR